MTAPTPQSNETVGSTRSTDGAPSIHWLSQYCAPSPPCTSCVTRTSYSPTLCGTYEPVYDGRPATFSSARTAGFSPVRLAPSPLTTRSTCTRASEPMSSVPSATSSGSAPTSERNVTRHANWP